jgi:hypothetical protein
MEKNTVDQNAQELSERRQEAKRRENRMATVVGIVGGVAIFGGIMAWYFLRVDQPPPPGWPGAPAAAQPGGAPADDGGEHVVMETGILDIVPLSEFNVKVKAGKAASVEVPNGSGLKAKVVDGKAVTISAEKDAKEGTHEVTVTDSSGQKAVIKVNIKK